MTNTASDHRRSAGPVVGPHGAASPAAGAASPAAGAASPAARAARAALLVVATGAWAGLVVWVRSMGNGPGTMGIGPARFMAMWSLMVTAMMLPLVARRATPGPEDTGRTVVLAAAYLVVWALVGVPAFGVAVLAGRLAAHHPAIATAGAVVILALAGLYQFTTTKRRCLERCRLPLIPGARFTAAVRSGTAYGRWCLACTGPAMALMVAFGFMNIGAMVVLALVIYAERFWFPGRWFNRLTGVASLALGVVVVVAPSVAAGLHRVPPMVHQMPHM